MEQSLRELLFTLHRQQREKYKQILTLSPMENFLQIPMERGLGAILTKICRSLLCAILLNWASARST